MAKSYKVTIPEFAEQMNRNLRERFNLQRLGPDFAAKWIDMVELQWNSMFRSMIGKGKSGATVQTKDGPVQIKGVTDKYEKAKEAMGLRNWLMVLGGQSVGAGKTKRAKDLSERYNQKRTIYQAQVYSDSPGAVKGYNVTENKMIMWRGVDPMQIPHIRFQHELRDTILFTSNMVVETDRLIKEVLLGG